MDLYFLVARNSEVEAMKLKPCPFCGGEAIKTKRPVIDEGVVTLEHEIICSWCGCRIARLRLEQYVIEAWNRRDSLDEIVEELEG